MANEKILNTRIALKIDELSKWNSSNLILKKGEIAIATVSKAASGADLAEPVTMIKIGDGTKTFSALPYDFYGKASDVYSWAKAKGIEVELVETTKPTASENEIIVVTGVEYQGLVTGDASNNTKLQIKLSYGLAATKKYVDDAIGLLEDKNTVTTVTQGDGITVTDALTDGNHAYTVALSPETENRLKKADSALQEHQSLANYYTKDETETAITSKGYAATTQVETAKQEAIDAAATDATNKANTAETNAKTFATEEVNKMVAKYLTGDGAEDTIDTLNEIANWINTNEDAVGNINNIATRVKAIEDAPYATEKYADDAAAAAQTAAVGKAQELVNALATGAVKTNADAIASLNIKDGAVAKAEVAKAVEADAIVTGSIADKNVTKAKLEETVQDSLDKADTALQAAALKGTADPGYIDPSDGKTIHLNNIELTEDGLVSGVDTIISFAPVAKTGSTDDLIAGDIVWIFNCGDSTLRTGETNE